jgi:hypothetical protein
MTASKVTLAQRLKHVVSKDNIFHFCRVSKEWLKDNIRLADILEISTR